MIKTVAATKPLSRAEVTSQLADKVGITRKQALHFFEELSCLAYKQAKNSFVIPGIGKLELKERGPRKMIMRFGPDTGKERIIPRKKVVKFKVAKAAKDAILGEKKK